MKASDPPIIVEQLFNLDKETIWKALTEHEQMIQWFFAEIPNFEAKVGFETVFDVNAGVRIFPHHWKILDVIQHEKIIYDWHYGDAWKGRGKVVFEILEKNNGSTVRLTNYIIEDFDEDIPEFKRESCEGGWNYFIKEQLKKYLNQKSQL